MKHLQEQLALQELPDSDRKIDRKRKRLREAEDSLCIPAVRPQKRPRTALESSAPKDKPSQEVVSGIIENNIHPIKHWIQEGSWPKELFEQDSQTRKDFESDNSTEEFKYENWPEERPGQTSNMPHYLLARPKLKPSLRRKNSESSMTTPSDPTAREAKSAQYKRPSYETGLATKGSFMDKSEEGITQASKDLCQTLLDTNQTPPEDSLFDSNLFEKTCRKIRNRNEAMVIRDISLLIVPSAQTLATYGAINLEHLAESVNEGWNSAICFFGPRPQPDYSVGFGRSAWTDNQLQKLKPFVGEIEDTCTSYFMATWQIYFPFLTCEVKCGAVALDVADRQNSHSMTLAVRAVVELYRYVKREKELHREILAFSISHDHRVVRIYGHYALIRGEETNYYRHPIRTFDFTELDGKEKWTANTVTRNIYEKHAPLLYKRICSALEDVPSYLNFEISEQSELQFADDSQPRSQPSQESQFPTLSNAESMSALEEDDSLAGSQVTTPKTSFTHETQRIFKKPKSARATEQQR